MLLTNNTLALDNTNDTDDAFLQRKQQAIKDEGITETLQPQNDTTTPDSQQKDTIKAQTTPQPFYIPPVSTTTNTNSTVTPNTIQITNSSKPYQNTKVTSFSSGNTVNTNSTQNQKGTTSGTDNTQAPSLYGNNTQQNVKMYS